MELIELRKLWSLELMNSITINYISINSCIGLVLVNIISIKNIPGLMPLANRNSSIAYSLYFYVFDIISRPTYIY